MNSLDDLVPNLTKHTKIILSLNLTSRILLKYRIRVNLAMPGAKIVCEICSSLISQYYDEGYKGTRGKCIRCGIDFPLE